MFITFYLFQKYEIPGAKDIPIDFRVYIEKNSENPLGILRSKGKMTFLQVYSIRIPHYTKFNTYLCSFSHLSKLHFKIKKVRQQKKTLGVYRLDIFIGEERTM